jgi:copper(I)-binding protein
VISTRRAALAAAGFALLASLGACSPAADAPAKEDAVASAEGKLTVSNARVVLAPVAGNPAAVYFDLAWNGPAGVSLTSVDIEGAGMTMIHDYAEDAGKMTMVMADSVPLAADAPVTFAPGGLHVMAMDPGSELKPGSTAKVTFTLSDGAKVNVEAPVRAAGDER